MALLIALFGGVTIWRMSTDIFPEIDIPVASVIWTYNGISAEEMEKRIVTSSERGLTTTVNDIEHIESQALNGVAIIRVYFHPGAKIEAAVAQITAMSQSILRVFGVSGEQARLNLLGGLPKSLHTRVECIARVDEAEFHRLLGAVDVALDPLVFSGATSRATLI